MDPSPPPFPAVAHAATAQEIIAHARQRQVGSRTAACASAACGTAAPLLAPREGAFSIALAPILGATLRDWKGP